MADTDIHAGMALATRRKAVGMNGAAMVKQPHFASTGSTTREIASLAGGLA